MASKHYFICRVNPLLVLGPEKWLSHKELAEGKCPIYVFPDSKTAQTVQSSLPKTVKNGTTVRSQDFIEEALQVKFVPGVGFGPVERPASGPKHSEPIPREGLMRFSLPAWANSPAAKQMPGVLKSNATVVSTTDQFHNVVQLGGPPVMTTLLESTANRGRDTTRGNESVELSEELLSILDRYMSLKMVRAPGLGTELAQVDKEITDELHFVEFANVNAAVGYKSFRRLQELRLKRRAIKDSNLIVLILGKLLSSVTPTSLDSAKRQVAGLKNRKYKVRIPETFQHEMMDGDIIV